MSIFSVYFSQGCQGKRALSGSSVLEICGLIVFPISLCFRQTVSILISISVEFFVDKMERRLKALGYPNAENFDPNGKVFYSCPRHEIAVYWL